MRTKEDAELEVLLGRSAAGDEHAFGELYDRTRRRTYTMILSVLHAPDHAAEVMQELYVAAWRDAGRYDTTRGSVIAWLIMMARRRAIDRTRSVERAVTRDADSSLISETDAVWDRVESDFRAVWVRQALSNLRSNQRDALAMAYFGGYTQSQIAGLLELPLGTVKTRIRDGLTVLRRTMAVTP
jgi:RNA polymerase sigma-70 factor (ECF subfamily)